MKKTYIIPQMKVVVIETMHMIAESAPVQAGSKTYNQSLSRESDWSDED